MNWPVSGAGGGECLGWGVKRGRGGTLGSLWGGVVFKGSWGGIFGRLLWDVSGVISGSLGGLKGREEGGGWEDVCPDFLLSVPPPS